MAVRITSEFVSTANPVVGFHFLFGGVLFALACNNSDVWVVQSLVAPLFRLCGNRLVSFAMFELPCWSQVIRVWGALLMSILFMSRLSR